jgi:hypothetical protein
VRLGGEIKKVARTEEGRLKRDKHSPPLESRPRQKWSVLIGFQTCNKNLYSCLECQYVSKAVGVRSARLALRERIRHTAQHQAQQDTNKL